MECRAKQKILKREISNGQEALKEMFKVLNHQGKANHNISEVHLYPSEMVRSKSQEIAHTGKDIEQGEHSLIASRSANLNNQSGNQFSACTISRNQFGSFSENMQ